MSKYDDIINLPHHQSRVRKHMPQIDRAAQFAPFSALTGLDDAMKDAAEKNSRLMDRQKIGMMTEE